MIFGDYHTHTKNSDGKGTTEQTLQAAERLGLRQIGISDHGLKHIARGMHFKDIARVRGEIERFRDKYHVECLLAVEANIRTDDGEIDLTEGERQLFDYIIAGYHKAVLPKNLSQAFRYNIPAFFADWRRSFTDGQRRKFTKAVVGAVTGGKVNFISHLNYGIPVFVKEVGKAAVDHDVYVELNGKHVGELSDEDILTLQDLGVKFIINSDAHRPEQIGAVSAPVETVRRLQLNTDNIVNWQKIPDLKRK